jgi:hypothetical protein
VDIAAALTLLSQATGIVKDLRDIDNSFDMAALKLKMADLYSALADVRIGLSDARETIHERDSQIRLLQQRIATLTSGEACPICDTGRMKVKSSMAHPDFGFAGVQMRKIVCDNCGHTEDRLYDPGK